MQYIKTLSIPFVNSLPSSLFRTTVNGAKLADMKHVLTGSNIGDIESFGPSIDEEDEPRITSKIGEKILRIGDVIAITVSETILIE